MKRANGILAAARRALAWAACLVLLAAHPAFAQGVIIVDPGDVFQGDIDRMEVFARSNTTSEVFSVEVGPADVLDGPDDRRKSLSITPEVEFTLYGRAFAGNEYRISLLAQNLEPAVTLGNGEQQIALFKVVEVVFLPPQFIIEPLDTTLLQLVFRFSDGETINVDRSLFYVVFATPPAAGSLVAAGTGYAFTAGSKPGAYDITATVRAGDHPLHSYLSPQAIATVCVSAAIIKSPGGMAVTKDGTLFISDTEGGFVAMIPPGKRGFALVRGLNTPGDVELTPDGKNLIIAEAEGKVRVVRLGLTGQLRDLDGNLVVGANVVVETRVGGSAGKGSTKDVLKTDKEGLFHIFDLLDPLTSKFVPVFLTIVHSGKSYSVELPLAPEGHTFQEISFKTVELRVSRQGQGVVSPGEGSHQYPADLSLTVEATPNIGWRFDHWEGALSGSDNPGSLVMDQDQEIKAVFAPL